MTDPADSADPAYAHGQVARALATSATHDDPEVRARARARVEGWAQIIDGMRDGTLSVGDRAPIADTPVWATPQVFHGGFATGKLLAEGPLAPHEHALLRRLPDPAPPAPAPAPVVDAPPDDRPLLRRLIDRFVAPNEAAPDAEAGPPPEVPPRARLADWALSPPGLEWLLDRLHSGRYRLATAEEGALLAVAWLLDRGHVDDARAVLAEIGPFMHRLRFLPTPAERPVPDTDAVRLYDVDEVHHRLVGYAAPDPVHRLYATVGDIYPLLDRFVTLWVDALAEPARMADAGWLEGARAALAAHRGLCERLPSHRKLHRKGENLPTLARITAAAVDGRVTPGQRRQAQHVIDAIDRARGLPGSERHAARRAEQAAQIAAPLHDHIGLIVIDRLGALPPDGGVDDLDALLAPITADEEWGEALPAGTPVPDHFARRIRPAVDAPLADHLAWGTLGSAAEVARVLPPLTARVAAAGIDDPALARLYRALYAAFRRRRSLLLLSLQSQVRFTELPWVAAIERHRAPADETTREAARALLVDVVADTLTAYPYTLVPNPLVKELDALARRAGLELPLVEELAADIYMGAVTAKFLHAAQLAVDVIEGTLYHHYYDIDTRGIRRMSADTTRYGRTTADALTTRCRDRRSDALRHASRVTASGIELEQLQVLTTHDLAALVSVPGLRERLEPAVMATACFDHLSDALAELPPLWGSRLRLVKNAAYAWRQMVFWLSLAGQGAQHALLRHADERLASRRYDALRPRMAPALTGLSNAIKERPVEADGGRIVYGWTPGDHFLLPPSKRRAG